MLKLSYTDNKISLHCLQESLEEWINTRVLLSLRSSTSIYIKSSTASILVPADSFFTTQLEELKGENIVEFCRCDSESVEIVLKGIWLTSEVESETGLFVTEIEDKAEYLLQNMFEREFCHA
ncbi:MAG: alr0857 family protein [Cyanobacteria bacterium P01_H01_bin.150]